MSVGKESIKRAASAGSKKAGAAAKTEKAAAPKKAGAVKKTAKAAESSVVTPVNTEEMQVKFISGDPVSVQMGNGPIQISQELPIYLL